MLARWWCPSWRVVLAAVVAVTALTTLHRLGITGRSDDLTKPHKPENGQRKFTSSNPSENLTSIKQQESQSQNSESGFVDKLFDPIMKVFRAPADYALKSAFRSGPAPNLLVVSTKKLTESYWVDSLKQFDNGECPFRCTFMEDHALASTADAVLVYLTFFHSSEELLARLPKRDPAQPWIAFSVETPSHNLIQKLEPLASLNGIFNRTMTYRRDSDIVFAHGFVVTKEDAKLLPPSWVTPMQDDIKQLPFSERKLAVAFISNCKAASGRMDYITELKTHIYVDVYGECGNLSCGSSRFVGNAPEIQNDECLLNVSRNYVFYLSFENSFADDYVTEKLYNILLYPVVPVVFGGANYSEILPPGSYISAVEYKPAGLAEHLINLSRNESEYQKMLAWRKNYQVSTVGARRIFCDLCTKLHQPELMAEKVYHNFEYWFKTLANLKTYTENGIVPLV